MMPLLKKAIAALAVGLATLPAVAQISDFQQSTNTLNLQLVKVAGQYFSNMSLFLPTPPQTWQLSAKGSPVNPLKAADAAIFNLADSTLTVPVLKIDETIYSNVKMKLPAGGNWSVVDLGDVLSTTSPGYQLSYPIVSTMDNRYCTDANGELTFVLDNGQVWKHVADDPCCPQSVTTVNAENINGKSRVEIYPNAGDGPNQGNFRMVVSYTAQNVPVTIYTIGTSGAASTMAGSLSGVESCIVRPVLNIPNYPAGPGLAPLAVSSKAIQGDIGKSATVYISGGLEPYYVTADYPGISSYQLLPANPAVTGQSLLVTFKRGGDANLTVYDYNRSSTQIAVKTNPAPVLTPTPLTIMPSSIDVTEGTFVDLYIVGGFPPVTINNPNNTWVEAPGGFQTTPTVIRVKMLRSTGDVEMPLIFTDASGYITFIKIKIKPSTSAGGSGGGGIFH